MPFCTLLGTSLTLEDNFRRETLIQQKKFLNEGGQIATLTMDTIFESNKIITWCFSSDNLYLLPRKPVSSLCISPGTLNCSKPIPFAQQCTNKCYSQENFTNALTFFIHELFASFRFLLPTQCLAFWFPWMILIIFFTKILDFLPRILNIIKILARNPRSLHWNSENYFPFSSRLSKFLKLKTQPPMGSFVVVLTYVRSTLY